MTSLDPLELYKAQFHRNEELTQLNNAGQSPLARVARETIEHWARRRYEEGPFCMGDLVTASNEARVFLARFLGCQAKEIALFPSTANAISQIAFGLELKPDDEILVWDQEYPSNFYPWRDAAKVSGARFKVASSGVNLETPVEELMAQVTDRTRVIAISWVQYRSGAITDLKALTSFAKSKGIFVCADIIQGAGLLPFDFADSGLDAACGGAHKWMSAEHGVAYFCLREEHLETIRPLMTGAITYGTPDDAGKLDATARHDGLRFEPGGKAFAQVVALGKCADLFSRTGISRISQEAEWLSLRLMHGLRERGYVIHSPHGEKFRGAIVNFSPGAHSKFKTQDAIADLFAKEKIHFSLRPPGVRLSPHAHNIVDDIDRVLSLL